MVANLRQSNVTVRLQDISRSTITKGIAISPCQRQSDLRSNQTMREDFMRRVIAIAIDNIRSGAGGPFGALIAKDDRIIAEGVNRVTSNNDPTAHAEVLAIREACRIMNNFELDGCDLYTTCEPCPMCLGAIYWSRLARVFYGGDAADAAAAGFDDAFIYQELKHPHGKRRIPMIQAQRQEALSVFTEWKESSNKTPY
jgi:guanine deaminase